METSAIPVVDFQKYGLKVTDPKSVTSDVLETTAKEIYNAFCTIGFLYLINHGIEQRKVDPLFSVSKSFFDQPADEKRKCSRVPADHGENGWIALESETLNPERPVGDLKEAFNFTPGHDGLWPDIPAQFESTFVSLHADCTLLAERVLDVLSIGLKLKSVSTAAKPGQVRCGEHSDYGTITLLFQDDTGGLEKHRVLIPEEEAKKRQSRQSMSFFVDPNYDTMIKCLDGSDKYEPITYEDYLNYRFSLTVSLWTKALTVSPA